MADKPIKIEFTKEEVEHTNQAFNEIHFAYGCTLAEWAAIERVLYYWFSYITGMNERMARAVFFSGRSFNVRAEMLDAAIACAERPDPEITFLKAALKKAWAYSSFRNTLAHGEPMLNVVQVATDTRKIHYSIVQGKSEKIDPSAEATADDLAVAFQNFHALTVVMIDGFPPMRNPLSPSPAECLARVLALPNQANLKSDQTPSEPAQRSDEPVRRDKKAYRAAQAKTDKS